jgi:tetratricopeptide (TPR) repeat protein
MNSFPKIIPHAISVMLLTIASVAVGSTSENSEAARITEAVALYVQATPMDSHDTQRPELLKRAESILMDVIENNPESLDAHRKLMGVYLQMRDYRKAIQTMQAAIALAPGDPKLFIALAILYDHQGAYEYAVPILDQALALDPKQQLAQEYKASIEQKIEMQKLAMESSTDPHAMAAPHPR